MTRITGDRDYRKHFDEYIGADDVILLPLDSVVINTTKSKSLRKSRGVNLSVVLITSRRGVVNP